MHLGRREALYNVSAEKPLSRKFAKGAFASLINIPRVQYRTFWGQDGLALGNI
jgi:hypothetical protein